MGRQRDSPQERHFLAIRWGVKDRRRRSSQLQRSPVLDERHEPIRLFCSVGVRLLTTDHGASRPLSLGHLGSDGSPRAHTDTSQKARGLTAKRFCTSRGAVRGVLAVRQDSFGWLPRGSGLLGKGQDRGRQRGGWRAPSSFTVEGGVTRQPRTSARVRSKAGGPHVPGKYGGGVGFMPKLDSLDLP